jgi:cbb3-type cytochrome oxidase maturation protein
MADVLATATRIPWWTLAFAVCFFMGLGAWLVFLWGVRTGQFRASDDVANQMLEQDQVETVGRIDAVEPSGRTTGT